MEFKFPVEVEPSRNQIEEVVNFWYNSLDSLKAEGDDRTLAQIIGSYQAANDNSAYFTQLAWAETSKVGKLSLNSFQTHLIPQKSASICIPSKPP